MLAWKSSKLTDGRKSYELLLSVWSLEVSATFPKLNRGLFALADWEKKGSLVELLRKERVVLFEEMLASLVTLQYK